MREFQITLPNGQEELIGFKRKGDTVQIKMGSKTYSFSKEEISNSSLASKWINGQILISGPHIQRALDLKPHIPTSSDKGVQGPAQLKALFPGRVMKILARENTWAKNGELLLVMESMKMEYNYQAPQKIFIQKILVKEGQILSKGDEFFACK